jgi:hypothetical protein
VSALGALTPDRRARLGLASFGNRHSSSFVAHGRYHGYEHRRVISGTINRVLVRVHMNSRGGDVPDPTAATAIDAWDSPTSHPLA